MKEHIQQLNDSQRAAVLADDGPALVIAGAGSGKTRVLTLRIAYLLSKGVKPWNILALTFTNKAAEEMKVRVGQIVGPDLAKDLWMGTFHSVFGRILRYEAEKVGFPSSYTIYDTSDSESLIRSILREMKIKEKEYKPRLIHSKISSAKNDLVLPSAYANDSNRMLADKIARVPRVAEIYNRYMHECKKAGAMDFDDLLLYTNILFRDSPEALEDYQNRFHYLLVDEYQDTNYSQYLIIKKLVAKHQNICVVGDDAQSIYSFRGAKIENILNFRNDYPDYNLYKLEQNYRSTQNIVNAANSIISKNKGQIKKEVFSTNDEGNKIKILSAISDVEEGAMVINDIINKKDLYGATNSEFAILYRTNAQSRVFEDNLLKSNISYKIYGGQSFYQRKEIKDVLAYLRLVVNPRDGEALKRVINYPARGIGQTTMGRLQGAATSHDVSLWEVVINPTKGALGINAGTVKKIDNFAAMIQGFIAQLHNMNAYEITSEIISQSGILKDLLSDKTIEGQTRVENIEEFINSVQDFSVRKQEAGEEDLLINFLEEISLQTDQDRDQDDDSEKITLMTIHAAKGLEFPYVYVVGVEENLFPSAMSNSMPDELEEERRLFYVAVTRAEKDVVLSYARNRYKYGEHTMATPSRFLREIDEQYIDNPESLQSRAPSFTQPRASQSRRFIPREPEGRKKFVSRTVNRGDNPVVQESYSPAQTGGLEIGSTVEHARFGIGEVLAFEGVMPDIKATIKFNNVGQKQLLLKFAKLKIIK